jgi:hypothetical protein
MAALHACLAQARVLSYVLHAAISADLFSNPLALSRQASFSTTIVASTTASIPAALEAVAY